MTCTLIPPYASLHRFLRPIVILAAKRLLLKDDLGRFEGLDGRFIVGIRTEIVIDVGVLDWYSLCRHHPLLLLLDGLSEACSLRYCQVRA